MESPATAAGEAIAAAPIGHGRPLRRPVVLVGLMGAGKTAIGRRLAGLLVAPFSDADEAIAVAAGMPVPQIFERYGEPAFRELERRVVLRMLGEAPRVLALGGGAFVDPEIRGAVCAQALSVWLKADLETLLARTAKRPGSRPLLAGGEPRVILSQLMAARDPLYAQADLMLETGAAPPDQTALRLAQLVEQSGALE